MAHNVPVTQEQVDCIIELYETGKTCEWIGEYLGLACGTISNHLRKNGVDTKRYREVPLSDLEKRMSNRRFLAAIKLTAGCIDCGYQENHIALHFDHRDGSTKRFSLSEMQRYSKKTLIEEVMKCDVRCANCHAIKTSEQFEWNQI